MADRRRPALWSPEALDDREKIWDYYTRAAGLATAEKMLRAIGDAVSVIEEHPFAGRARGEVREGLHSFVADLHAIFYRIVDGVPQIVRVLDGRQDIEDAFATRDDT